MKLLFASDSFKGTISSKRTSELLVEAAHCVIGSDVECRYVLMADGGEGTVDAIVTTMGGRKVSVLVDDPLGRMVEAQYGIINEDTAVIEMASASGLTLLSKEEYNPMLTSTYGTGQLISDALGRGCRRLYVAIGGSATNDGGMGCLSALGVKLKDKFGNVLHGRGEDLIKVDDIDVSGIDERLHSTEVIVLCDVRNPLCGPSGATKTYASQKGASEYDIELLESGMCNYRDCIKRKFGVDVDEMRGSGASGGLGAALMAFMNAKKQSGADAVIEITEFDAMLEDVDVVITGEGRIDKQTCFGKVVYGVASACKRKNIPVMALVGDMGDGYEEIYESGVDKIFALTDYFTIKEALNDAEKTYFEVAKMMFRSLKK